MTSAEARALTQRLFAASPAIRYVAFYQAGDLFSEQASGIRSASASETDRYEELLVNPALLTLAKQRGDIDCGGLRYLIVCYGNFYQLVRLYKSGHVSVCIELSADAVALECLIASLL